MKRLCAALLVAVAAMTCPAQAQQTAGSTQGLSTDDVLALFDPSEPEGLRQQALQAAIMRARAKDSDALYLLGVLYAGGRQHPAGLVDTDLQRAERYLSNAAVQGALTAIPRLTEVEIDLGKPDAAAVWAAIYLYYEFKSNGKRAEFGKFVYDRAVAANGKSFDESANTANANALIERYGQDFERFDFSDSSVLPISNADRKLPELDRRHSKFPAFPPAALRDQALDMWRRWYVTVVDEAGKVQKALFVDTFPDESARYQASIDGLRYDSAVPGSGPRFVFMHYDWVRE